MWGSVLRAGFARYGAAAGCAAGVTGVAGLSLVPEPSFAHLAVGAADSPASSTPAVPAAPAAPTDAAAVAAAAGLASPARGSVKLFSGNGNPKLAAEIASLLHVKLGDAHVGRFVDGEVAIQVLENVRGEDVFIIQPTCAPVNENLMELLLMVSTMRRASAKRITCVIPYYGYKRSTGAPQYTRGRSPGSGLVKRSVGENNSPISGADVAEMLNVMGADRVVAVDLQPPGQGQIEGFFASNVTVDNIESTVLGVEYFRERFSDTKTRLVVVAPTEACMKKARDFQSGLLGSGYRWNHDDGELGEAKVGVALITSKPNMDPVAAAEAAATTGKAPAPVLDLVGDVAGADVLIVDDMIDSARTLLSRVKLLKSLGAKRISCYATHGVFSGTALERLQESELEEVVVTNTIPIPEPKEGGAAAGGVAHSKVKQISIAPIIADVISRIAHKETLQTFRMFNSGDVDERFGGQENKA